MNYDAINIYYKEYLCEMGGIETVTYNIAAKYAHKKDILFLIGGHPNQIKRIIKLGAKVAPIDKNKTYRCKRVFVTSEKEIPEFIIYDEAVRISHANPEDLMRHGFKLPKDMDKAINYGVSRDVCETTEKLANVKCEYCPNPYIEEEVRPLLKLISPQRMTWEKGMPLMQKMAAELDKHNIPFQWIVACNNYEDVKKLDNPSFMFLKSRLDIKSFIKEADYLVLLSNTEGSPMAPQEALMMGIPIIVTHIPWVDDLDIKDKGFFLNLDLSDLDVEEIYKRKGTFKFNWNPPEDFWGDLLLDGKCEKEIELMELYKVKATGFAKEKGIYIGEANGIPEEDQEFEITKDRIDVLLGNNKYNAVFIKDVRKIETEKTVEKKEEPTEDKPKPKTKKKK